MTGVVSKLASAATAAAQASSPEMAKLKTAATQFEAVFLRQMIGSMRTASDNDGVFDSSATQQFRDMGDAKLADQMASHGALHIADMLVKEYGARMGAAAKTATTTAATTATASIAQTAATTAAELGVGK